MQKKIHIVGVGGVGMSAIAQALLDTGEKVSGSDRLFDGGGSSSVLACLARQGVELFPQDGSGIDATTRRVVISSAIEADNPDLLRANTLDLEVEHRSKALKRIVAGRELVAVTGTCGKSSVTAMLGVILEGCGFDPLVVNGAAVTGWDNNGQRVGSVRKGPGIAVIEADESDKSLMIFNPEHAIVTNASADHFDLTETLRLFEDFKCRVKGHLVDGMSDDQAVMSFKPEGLSGNFKLGDRRYFVPVPGLHNLYNALHAVKMALVLGARPASVAAALKEYKGVERRLQLMGRCGDAFVFDDYAHNPEKIGAAWRTLARAFRGGLCCLWRPHGYAPLRKMMTELERTFKVLSRTEDFLILLPVYDAGGCADRSVCSEDLAFKLSSGGVKVEVVAGLEEAEERMREMARDHAVLLCCGARDPGLPELAARLAE